MITAFKQYLSTLKLGSVSRKLYFSDVQKFLRWSTIPSVVEGPTLDKLSSPATYTKYLDSLRASATAPSMIKRTTASLKQFGTFLALTYSVPNPVTIAPLSPLSSLLSPNQNYIKHFTNYLNAAHLSPLTIKSYKSDITRYLDWTSKELPGTELAELLKDKNIKKYLNHLSVTGNSLPSTIERKDKSLTRFQVWYSTVYAPTHISDNIAVASDQPKEFRTLRQRVFGTSATVAAPDTSPNPVKKSNSRISLVPNLATASVRNFAALVVLLLFTATLAVFGYRQFNRDVRLTAAYPSTPVTPNRQLSFQGRLENAGGTPITTATDFVFKLFTASSGGTELYSSGTCSIDPDSDGVFNTQIGDTCGAGITSSVFTENQDVWLEVKVGTETLDPRQQIATVAYALNSETIQGFPISSTVSAIRNTVVPMNQWGEIIVGEQSPRLTGMSGTFAISAPALTLSTTTGSNGNITLAPDGTGQVNLNGNTTSTNFFNVSNAQLTTGSLITGTAANNNTGFKLLDLLSGASPTSKFSVTDAGLTTVGADLYVSSGISLFNNAVTDDTVEATKFCTGDGETNCVTDFSSFATGTNYWTRSAGNISPLTLNDTVSATTSAAVALTITQTGAFDAFLVQDAAGDTTPFVIDQSGNVGIGTTGPTEKLEVSGHIKLSATGNQIRDFNGNNLLNNNAGTFTLGNAALNIGTIVQQTGSATVSFKRDSTTDLFISGTGNVGIGTTGPDARLDSLATTEQLRLTYTDGTVYSSHTVDSSGNLTIDNTGTKTIIADDLQITGGDILDSNGNESIRFGTTASAINEATLTNAATAGTVLFAATGGDTDVALSIDSKGADALNLNGTATGDVNLAGGYGGTGCTVTNSNGNLSCNGTITGTFAGTLPWSSIIAPTANLSLAHAGYTTAFTFDSVTTADAFALSSSSLTTGTILDLSSTSTAGGASGLSKILDITRSGTNANASHTAYGLYSAVTNTGTTSTNIGGYFSASGATNNYGLIVANGNVGIGTTAPVAKLELAGVTTAGTGLRIAYTDPAFGVLNIYTRGDSPAGPVIESAATDGGYAGLMFRTGLTPADRMYITPTGNVGIGDTTPDALLDLDSTATTGNIFGILSTTLTTGEIADITATYAPTDGSTNDSIDINLTHSPTTLADNFSGINLTTTDGTALGNTLYNYNSTLTLTGNAAKTGIGLLSSLSTSSTTADTLVGFDTDTTVTGIMTTGTRNIYGLRSQPTAGAESTGGTTNVYGGYFKPSADVGAGGTVNGYGLYVANGTYDTDGTSTNTGLYVESPTGADTNYAAIFAGGNVGIGTTAPDAALEINHATGDSLRLTYNDSNGGATAYTDFSLASDGDLTIDSAGGALNFSDTLNFAGGTTYFIDNLGNAKFLDLQVADTGNAGLTVGNGSTGFAKIGSLTIGDNNASVITFDANSDATPEFQLYDTGSATASGDVTMGGQLQVGRFAAAPTAVGPGAVIFNTTTSTHQCWNGSVWYNCGGTLYSNTNAAVADGSYLTVTHSLATNDLISSAWINAQGVWKSLESSYQPAIAWEGKDTSRGNYHDQVNLYTPSEETNIYTENLLQSGLLFDTFEDSTKTDSANTTASTTQQMGDDGSANYMTLADRVQAGRTGLMGGQTYATSTTDNDGQTYLGSNTVNDIYYYDRTRDSVPEVLVELGIDPNWYNGVTLSVATSSASYSQNGTIADKNPNLTPSYNGSLIKATGTDSTPRTIFITIKTPTTFDWSNYDGDAATGVTITPGTAQTLGSTGVSVTFSAVNYNVGDVFKVASWFIEGESATRGAKQQFPERAYIIGSGSGGSAYVDIIDADTQKAWMKFSSNGVGYAGPSNMILGTTSGSVSSVYFLNGQLYVGKNGTSSNDGFDVVRFDSDSGESYYSTNNYYYRGVISQRNTQLTPSYSIRGSNKTLVTVVVNDVAAAVIPSQPTQEVTVSGWGYIVGDATAVIEETVLLPYKFNQTPNVLASHGGFKATTAPTSLSECTGVGPSDNGASTDTSAMTNNSFLLSMGRTTGTFASTVYYCYTWTATGTVSPKQFVAVATGATSADGGTTIINETDGTKATVLDGSLAGGAVWTPKVAFGGNTLYINFDLSTGGAIAVYKNVHGLETESAIFNRRNGNYGLNGTTSPWYPEILGSAGSPGQITSLTVTENTSTNEPNSNTIYVGTVSGVSVINEYQGNLNRSTTGVVASEEGQGSVKYYTKDFVSEEMIGDIRGMWPLNNANASSDFEDVSTNANTLTGTNITAAGDSVSGVRGTATDFDGSTEYLSRADDADFDFSTAMSFSVWIKTTDTGASNMIFRKFETSVEDKDVYTDANGKVNFYLYNVFGGANLTSNRSVNDGNWHHIAGTYDGATAALYIDGQLDNTKSASGDIADGTGVLYIGASVGTANFAGAIDELMITATTLTSGQIKNMYQVGSRALQSHSTSLGSSTADSQQMLGGTTNTIGVVQSDWNNQFMYVGSNSTTLGALSKIQLNSDTNIKTYNSSANVPTGGPLLLDEDITSLGVGYNLEAVGSAAGANGGVKSMGVDNNATATSGNFVSKTYALPKNIGSAVLWVSPILDASDVSNTLTVKASNDSGSNYVTCTLVNTNSSPSVPEKEYACTFTTADNDLKVKFEFVRGSTKTNTYVTQYGISWLGETGFRVEQADTNNVRLYNFSGETQNLKLNVTGASTAALANPWTDGGSYLYATGYEALRVYDGAGTNYLSLSNSGTYAQLGWNGTAALSIASTGDISTTNGSGVIIGNPTQLTLTSGAGNGFIPELQVLGTGITDSSIAVSRSSADTGSGRLTFNKSRNAAIGSFTVVQSGDSLGQIDFGGDDGTDYNSTAAWIRGAVDGTPGTGDMPGRLMFATSADGAESPTERMRIDSQGYIGIGAVDPKSLIQFGNYGTLSGDGGASIHTALGFNTYYSSGDKALVTGSRSMKLELGNNGIIFYGSSGTQTADAALSTYGEWMRLGTNGYLGVGQSSPTYQLDVFHNTATEYVARFFHDGNNANRNGIVIQNGTDDNSGSNVHVAFLDGDGNDTGFITSTGGTTTYGAFTANHDTSIPMEFNETGYDYGTLLCVDDINVDPNAPRKIEYNSKACDSGPYSNKILGAYASKYSSKNNLHQVYILGDGHILVNGQNGDIKVGDSITTSSTTGIGMKATDYGTTFGRAQEDYHFNSPDESKLIAVQYGLGYSIPNTYLTDSGDFEIVGQEGNYSVKDIQNNSVVTRVGAFAEATIAKLKAGIGQFNKVETNLISPLTDGETIEIKGPVSINPLQGSVPCTDNQQGTEPCNSEPLLTVDGEISSDTVSARVAKLQDIQAENITAKNIVADTISANHIDGLDAKIATLSAELTDAEVESITDRIKARLALLTGNAPSAEDVPIPAPETTDDPSIYNLESNISTTSATLASADIDFATINDYLAVIGTATITELEVTGHLYATQIESKTGLLALGEGTLLIDSNGHVAINGDLTVSGKIIADSASLSSLSLGSELPNSSEPSALGKLLSVYDESGTAVATIDASGSANLASLTTNMITIASPAVATQSGLATLLGTAQSNATAGQNILVSPGTELTIESPYVTPNSLVYLTPTGNTDNKVVFVKSKHSCDKNNPELVEGSLPCIPSFTVGIDAPASSDISFNWWIIELATPSQ